VNLASIMSRVSFKISFSKILEKKGKRLMGLYEAGESGGFLGLRIMLITKNFHSIGCGIVSAWSCKYE